MREEAIWEAENAVLGAMLEKPELIDVCYLQPEEFDSEDHQLILQYLQFLNENDIPVNLVSMAEQSGKNIEKIGGISYLVKLKNQGELAALSFGFYQKSIRDGYIHRRTVRALGQMAEAGRAGSVEGKALINATMEEMESLSELSRTSTEKEMKKMSDVLLGHDKAIRTRQNQQGITGTKTASEDLDRLTSGHQDGDLIIIAARPSIGKTAFIINDMIAAARAGRTVAMFSLEMPALKVAERFLCAIGNIDATRMRTGQFTDTDWERWSFAIDELEGLPIFIDDTPGMTVQDIRRKVKAMKKKNPMIIAYVDYLQLVQPGRNLQTREATTFVTRQLKQLARKENCPVIAISSVGRSCEQRQDKRPLMSDLKESGDIEFEADIIIFLYREDYYDPHHEKKGIMEVIVAKGRNVGTGLIEVVFIKKTGKIANVDRNAAKKEEPSSGGAANQNGGTVQRRPRPDASRSSKN
jgi:replicative DNA helicase